MRHPSVRPGAGALGLPAADVDPVVSGSLEAEAVIMGLPFDAGVTGVPGQRHGPEIFRKLSPGHDWSVDDDGALGGLIDPLTGGRCSCGRRVFDLGDLGAVPIDPRVGRAAYYRALTGLVDRLTRTRAVPLFIGGDHSLSAPVVTGLAAVHGPVRVVCFDAHCDFGARPMPGVTDITHGDFLGHLFQTGAVTACELYGVRTLLPASCGPLPADLRCTYAYGFPEAGGHRGGRAGPSVDRPRRDRPHGVPGDRTPRSGGYRLRELLAAVEHVCRTRRVVAVDIVEALQDDRENRATSATISALVMSCLRALLDDHHRGGTRGR